MKMMGTGQGRQIVGSGVRVSMAPEGTRLEMSTVGTLVKLLSADQAWPVLDNTGLTGRYRIVLNISNNPPPSLDPDTVTNQELDAVEEQIGLRVERGKAPIEAIVIDHIEKTPTEN